MRLWAIADIHGQYFHIENFFNKNKDTINFSRDTDVIIILGDAGLNYYFNKRDEKLKKRLSEYPFQYFIIRGNHEDRPSHCMEKFPNDWHIEKFWENEVYIENNYPNIKYSLDIPAKYNIPITENLTINTLVLPGAFSVDKYYRILNGWSWFDNEQPTEEEMKLGKELAATDAWGLILSHTCPIGFEPTDMFIKGLNQSIIDKTTERWLGGIEFNTIYNLWCWGHFHNTRIYPENNHMKKIMLFNDYV